MRVEIEAAAAALRWLSTIPVTVIISDSRAMLLHLKMGENTRVAAILGDLKPA